MKKKIKVGVDFDGVIAYNPFRIARAPIVYLKRVFFGVEKVKFFFPQSPWQKILWKMFHASSVFPARGVGLLRELVEEGEIEAHLITGRYSFLEGHLNDWLKKYKLTHLFKTINVNKQDEQPHLFKERVIKLFNLDIFIEDNWDIVHYLHGKNSTKIYWIYNILDRKIPFERKFPYIEAALKEIISSKGLR